ncbi:MAG TPA: hypothetical protein VET23_10185, partial [Chitinophagaceae bacterium]|nr:hypothetical protein [Chitinophagaceae bacterium]
AITGFLIIILNLTGRLGMGNIDQFTKTITNASLFVNQYVGGNIILNLGFVILIGFVFYKIAKKI